MKQVKGQDSVPTAVATAPAVCFDASSRTLFLHHSEKEVSSAPTEALSAAGAAKTAQSVQRTRPSLEKELHAAGRTVVVAPVFGVGALACVDTIRPFEV